MSIVSVQDQKTVVIFACEPQDRLVLKRGCVVLDSVHFPWKVLYLVDDNNETLCVLKAIRPLKNPHKIQSLQGIEEALIDAYRDTIYNYQVLIESRDLEVAKVYIWQEDYATIKMSSTYFPEFYYESSSLPKAHITIVDKEGVTWGPLPCHPIDGPFSWPLPGSIGQATILPEGERRVKVSDSSGILNIYLDTLEQAIKFASILNDTGWEQALKRFFPDNVFRLSVDVTNTCTPPDEDLKH
jgi:hypothetical protein